MSRRILASQEVNSEMRNLCSHDDLNTSESQHRLRYKSRTIIFRKKLQYFKGLQQNCSCHHLHHIKTQKRNVEQHQSSYFNILLENVHADSTDIALALLNASLIWLSWSLWVNMIHAGLLAFPIFTITTCKPKGGLQQNGTWPKTTRLLRNVVATL